MDITEKVTWIDGGGRRFSSFDFLMTRAPKKISVQWQQKWFIIRYKIPQAILTVWAQAKIALIHSIVIFEKIA